MSTAGKRSERVQTERHEFSASDLEKELISLGAEDGEHHNWLFYGDHSAGKTRCAGTAPGKTFWLIGEPGYKSASRAGARGRGFRIGTTARALAAIDFLNTRSSAPGAKGRRRYELLDWVIVDGASTLEKRWRIGYAQEAFDINPASRQHRNLPDRPDYFNTQNFWMSFVPQLVDMPVNVIFTAHAYRTDKTDNGELLGFPGFQGKVNEISNTVAGLFDLTGYLEHRRVKTREGEKLIRRMFFESPPRRTKEDSDVRYVCGEKYGVLGTHMDSPTVPKLLAKIEGESNAGS